MINLSALIVILFVGMIMTLSVISPYTYNWIIRKIKDTVNLFIYSEKTGTFAALADTHLSFPTGKGIVLGEGHRIYSVHGRSMGYHPSDIGYVNDMFMGGFIYISILRFLRKKPKNNCSENKQDYILQSLISIQLIIALLIANYKGEVMRGGAVIFVAVYIKLALANHINSRKEVG